MRLVDVNRDGDETAPPDGETSPDFAAQFKASYRVLWMIAMGIVADAAEAEDVVQEAALLGLQKLDQFRPGTNFRAWMAQMVRYVALNTARKYRNRRPISLDAPNGNGAEPHTSLNASAETHLSHLGELPADQTYFDDQMVNALNAVTPVARACLLLRTLEGLEYAEISGLLDIPTGTAMSHVHRTRQYLRQRLASRGSAGAKKEARP